MKYVANAFSLQMLREPDCLININRLSEEDFKKLSFDAYSIIGHKDIADVLGLEYNRESVKVNPDDIVLVAQLSGGRLPEGATKIPKNRKIEYFCIQIIKK